MQFDTILYDVDDGILTITLNRPEILNAFSGAMLNDLLRAFDLSDADDEIGAVIITGAGRGFCAGQDLSVIVAFNGPAVGVGMTFTCAADIRIAARNVKMGFVFSARGIVPEGCSSWFLPRIVLSLLRFGGIDAVGRGR